jgi:hypothetical protein
MRLFTIRHAESMENIAMNGVIDQLIRGEIKGQDLHQCIEDAMLAAAPPHGDSELSDTGLGQAEKLGAFWAPIFEGKAKKGKVRYCA